MAALRSRRAVFVGAARGGPALAARQHEANGAARPKCRRNAAEPLYSHRVGEIMCQRARVVQAAIGEGVGLRPMPHNPRARAAAGVEAPNVGACRLNARLGMKAPGEALSAYKRNIKPSPERQSELAACGYVGAAAMARLGRACASSRRGRTHPTPKG